MRGQSHRTISQGQTDIRYTTLKYDQLFSQRTILSAILLISVALGVSAAKKDTLILGRIYEYQQAHNAAINGIQDNVYAKFRFNVERRNATLWLIPTMDVLCKDPREYIRESYNKVTFNSAHDFDINSQVLSGTVKKNRKALPTLIDFATPNIYDVALYEGHMLSPFNKVNRRYYTYTQKLQTDSTTRLDFRPKHYNTQLLNGYAIVETGTGRIIRTLLNGEYDMLSFRTEVTQGEEGVRSIMPSKCTTAASFRFMGNRISALFDAAYDCPLTLPDSIAHTTSRELMDSIRPIPLSETDKRIYQEYDKTHQPDSVQSDTVPQKKTFRQFLWQTGDNLVTPIAAEAGRFDFYLTPIINPLYLRYSGSKGISYKMRLYTTVSFNQYRYLTFEPTLGYNFKLNQFFFDLPLRMTYNPKRNGYAEIIYGNDNHISNSTVADLINHEHGDTLDFDNTDIDMFKDNYLRVFNNIMLFDWFDIETGLVIHKRTAVNREIMRQYGMPEVYRSFAPMIGLKFLPWLDKGPLISLDWERGIKGVNGSNISYERWELDASWKHRIPGLRVLNLRAGGGFYTDRSDNYFLDYANFRDNNLPEGWDDDWSGDFQLLDSRLYNESDYYIRANVSYETPMLFATWTPYLGKYIEKERLYISAVNVEHTRPYFEIGYGFTNRYISVGIFASFHNVSFQSFGIACDFELFKRW